MFLILALAHVSKLAKCNAYGTNDNFCAALNDDEDDMIGIGKRVIFITIK